jgi:pseudaminic acid biosynthesis-associated methylase
MENVAAETRPPAPTSQLAAWTGDFGDAYADRNDFDDWKLAPGTEAFRRMVGGLKTESILEVGSNIGLNLLFLNTLFQGSQKLYAVEPNAKAFHRLTSQDRVRLAGAWNTDAFHLPLADASVDLVFTAGVLIHIAPEDLGAALDEIVRVSRRYVLCIEYFSHQPVEVPYHGHSGLLFKRDFGAFYLDRFPQLRPVDYGFLWQREFKIFDNLNWWLFEKLLMPIAP